MGFEKKQLVWSLNSIIWLVKAAFYFYQQFVEHQAAGWWILLPRTICSELTRVHSAMYPWADATTADLYHTEYEKVKRPSAAGIERRHQWFMNIMNYFSAWHLQIQSATGNPPTEKETTANQFWTQQRKWEQFHEGKKPSLYLGGAQSCRVQSSSVPT